MFLMEGFPFYDILRLKAFYFKPLGLGHKATVSLTTSKGIHGKNNVQANGHPSVVKHRQILRRVKRRRLNFLVSDPGVRNCHGKTLERRRV